MRKLYLLTLAINFIIIQGCAHADGVPNYINETLPALKCSSEIETISQLIEASDYIALYDVHEIKNKSKSDETALEKDNRTETSIPGISRADEEAFRNLFSKETIEQLRSEFTKTFKLNRVYILKGNPPDLLTIETEMFPRGGRGFPTSFFFMGEQHQKMVDEDTTLLGDTSIYRNNDGACMISPHLTAGYLHIVFGNTLSKASVEPILSTSYDPLFLKVESQLRVKNSK